MALKGKPVAISNSATTIYTCPATKEAAVHGLIVGNNTGNQLAVTISVYNQADNTTTAVVSSLPVPANNFITWAKPINLNAGDSVQLTSNAASGMVALYSVYEDGATPVASGFTARGVWSSSASYVANDIVSVTGSGTYVAIQASTNEDPTTATAYWMFLEGISASALPSQTGQAGKYLTTDGSDASWGELDSSALSVQIPLASGQSLTAGSAVPINPSGEVGAYPVVNTLSSTTSNINTSFTSDNFTIAKDGSRGIYMQQTNSSASSNVRIYGFVPTDNGSMAFAGNYYDWNIGLTNYSTDFLAFGFVATPLNNSNLFAIGRWGRERISSAYDTKFYSGMGLVNVDASGNVSVVSVNTSSQNTSSPTYNFGMQAALHKDNANQEVSFLISGSEGSNYLGRAGWCNTTTASTGAVNGTNAWNYLNSGHSVSGQWSGSAQETCHTIAYSGLAVRYGINGYWYSASYNKQNTLGSTTSAQFITDISSNVRCAKYNETLVYVYTDTSFKTRMRVFRLNTSTGAPTEVANEILDQDATTSSAQYKDHTIVFKSETQFALSYVKNGIYRVNTFELNPDYSFKGKNYSLLISSLKTIVQYNSIDDNYYAISWDSNGAVGRTVEVGEYGTNIFSYIGCSSTNQSSSPANIVVSGVCGGFTGLTPGAEYYSNTNYDGGITTDSASLVYIGKAKSTTELVVGDKA